MIVLKELKINNVLGGQSQWSASSWVCQSATYQLVLLDSRCCSLKVKLIFPMTIFLNNNLGQDSYTVSLKWSSGPLHLFRSSWCKWLKCYSLCWLLTKRFVVWAHPGMPKNCLGAGRWGDSQSISACLCWHWGGNSPCYQVLWSL